MSIRTRLWLFVTALIGLVLTANALVVFTMEKRELRESFERESSTFATLAGPQALRAFGEGGRREPSDDLSLKLAAIAGGLPSLKAMVLLSPRGRVLAGHPRGVETPALPELDFRAEPISKRRVEFKGEELLELVLPVHGSPDSPSVLVQLLVSEAAVNERVNSLYFAYGGSLALLLIFGAMLAERVSRHILKPVESLKNAAGGLRDGNLSSRAEPEGTGEINELAKIFNDMAVRLESSSREMEERNLELTRAYGELQALHEELSNLEKMAAVGRTAAAVSHEIDNPIGVILGTASMLRKELSDRADLAEDLALIEAECARCRRIVRDLLDFAKPSPGGGRAVDLPQAVSLVLRGLKHHPELKAMDFRLTCSDEPITALADPDAVKQVVLNLLLNAAKAMGQRGVVEIEAVRRGGFAEVAVLDRGHGVEESEREKIFMPHFTTGGGSGLGLTVSRRLLEQAGGRLAVESRPGGGSIFRASWLLEE